MAKQDVIAKFTETIEVLVAAPGHLRSDKLEAGHPVAHQVPRLVSKPL